uniref:Uncharacterized protein n=1 Tax=Rhizophora mucronata TaxID=61149 RepID=A0A2P2PYQ9_RHIMU
MGKENGDNLIISDLLQKVQTRFTTREDYSHSVHHQTISTPQIPTG